VLNKRQIFNANNLLEIKNSHDQAKKEILQILMGLNDAKLQIITHILYLTRGLGNEKCASCIDCDNNVPCMENITDKFHTVIYGPPGVGKTTFAKILSQIYSVFGSYNDDFHVVSRSDLISGYMGRTAKKTQKIIDKCENGVLFIQVPLDNFTVSRFHKTTLYKKYLNFLNNTKLSTANLNKSAMN
jgi:hypothetical protein